MKTTGFLLVAALSVLAGCKRDDSAATPPTVQPAPPVAVTTAPPAPVAEPAPAPAPAPETPAAAGARAQPAATVVASSAAATSRADKPPVLRAVRSARQPGADRVTFEFDTQGLPAWHAEYVDRPVRDCGSGDAVPVAGDAWLQIRFTGAQAHSQQGQPTSGPRRRTLAGANARELVRICDFEGEVTWVVGVARPSGYKTMTLSAPSRLVIDIAN